MKALLLALGLVAFAAIPARAEEDDAARAARWDLLRQAVFGERSVADGAGILALDAPMRAMDAALVPVSVILTGKEKVKAIYLLVDDNPSPLAGSFHFGPAADPHTLKTRVRVEQYTLVHAVAETEDGRLFAVTRFVKAAGGCSAPEPTGARLAEESIGRMKLRVQAEVTAGQPMTAELLINHPNYNGMQMDQVTRNYTPARFVQTVKVSYNGVSVFDLDSDISLSEDPTITFSFVPPAPGKLSVEVEDSTKAVFRRSFEVPVAGG